MYLLTLKRRDGTLTAMTEYKAECPKCHEIYVSDLRWIVCQVCGCQLDKRPVRSHAVSKYSIPPQEKEREMKLIKKRLKDLVCELESVANYFEERGFDTQADLLDEAADGVEAVTDALDSLSETLYLTRPKKTTQSRSAIVRKRPKAASIKIADTTPPAILKAS